MKKYDLLLKYLDFKICVLRENNQEAYDRFMRQDGERDEEYQYVRGTHMGYDNAMEIINKLLDEFKEGNDEH